MNQEISHERNLFANIPIGLMGTTLGMLILANVYEVIGFKSIQFILMNIGAFILALGLIKLIAFPKKVWQESKKPELYSTYIAFPMAVMTLGKFYLQYNLLVARILWYGGAALDIFIVLTFLFMYVVKKPKLESISPSWFLLLVGSVVIPASNFDTLTLPFTRIVWLCCLVAYIVILPLVAYRCLKLPLPKAIYPYLGITSAPASLLIVGYLSVIKPDIQFLSCMLLVAIIMTAFVYVKMYKIFILKFKPSFAGLTFPLAISCLCEFKTSAYYEKLGYTQIHLILKSLGYLELIITSIVILAILIMFFIHFLKLVSKQTV